MMEKLSFVRDMMSGEKGERGRPYISPFKAVNGEK